jgi:hypothetical protein
MMSDIEKAARAFRQLDDVSGAIAATSAFGRIANQLMGLPDMRGLNSFTEQVKQRLLGLESVTRFAEVTKSFEMNSILPQLSPISSVLQELQEQNERWQSITVSLDSFSSKIKVPTLAISQIASSALVWDTGVSETLKCLGQVGILSHESAILGRLFEPSNTLSRFTERTSALMKIATAPNVVRALNASLILADAQFLANTDALNSFALTVIEDDGVSSPASLTSPYVQQEDLLACQDVADGTDINVLVSQSPAAQASERARSALNLIARCNKASATKGKVEIFKPTTKLMEVYVDLPLLTPLDEKSFGEFIDCLYFALYEGAGKDKLRFLEKHDGPLSETECEVVWCIKTFRNKWLRHDADHGKVSDIQRSWTSLDGCFRRLGLSGFPRSSRDYRKLHEQLLQEMEAFLATLFQKI